MLKMLIEYKKYPNTPVFDIILLPKANQYLGPTNKKCLYIIIMKYICGLANFF